MNNALVIVHYMYICVCVYGAIRGVFMLIWLFMLQLWKISGISSKPEHTHTYTHIYIVLLLIYIRCMFIIAPHYYMMHDYRKGGSRELREYAKYMNSDQSFVVVI